MRKAILYIRVSTDEQADKGYSLQHQEERLRKYCEMQNIEVTHVYKDDYSAKTFNRPEFTRLLNGLRKHRAKVDLLLFLKWDRFSRNTGDAYGMINTLTKLGVDPQAIEQPLDLNIPENKIMLAFYLAAPEVENDRRAMNVFAGMRRAKKEGRWMATAPKGYKNIHNEAGRPIIVPNKDAPLFIWVFEELEKGHLSAEEVRRQCNKKGLKCSKNNFYTQIRNPVYCGKIQIPAYKDEEAYVVKGIHEPLISEDLFERVQDVLNGRRKNKATYKTIERDELPLRGFLQCPRCGKNLTGSGSTGGSGVKSYYYHCCKGCKERVKAFTVNDKFIDLLKTLVFKKEVEVLYQEIIKEVFKANSDEKHFSQKELQEEIGKNRERLNNAQQMLLDKSISPEDYREMKSRYEPIIDRLARQHLDTGQTNTEFKKYLKKGLQLIKRIDQVYMKAPLPMKQRIIRSIFPEKLRFEENEVRTGKINRLITLISRFCKGYSLNKKGTEGLFALQSHQVIPLGLEPRTPTLKVLCSTN